MHKRTCLCILSCNYLLILWSHLTDLVISFTRFDSSSCAHLHILIKWGKFRLHKRSYLARSSWERAKNKFLKIKLFLYIEYNFENSFSWKMLYQHYEENMHKLKCVVGKINIERYFNWISCIFRGGISEEFHKFPEYWSWLKNFRLMHLKSLSHACMRAFGYFSWHYFLT